MDLTTRITFRTHSQAALFERELKGQFSDGQWENATPHNHWIPWSDAIADVGVNVGRNFLARKDGYGLTAKDFVDCLEDRMIGYAKEAISYERGIPVEEVDYGRNELLADLREIKKTMKIYNGVM